MVTPHAVIVNPVGNVKYLQLGEDICKFTDDDRMIKILSTFLGTTVALAREFFYKLPRYNYYDVIREGTALTSLNECIQKYLDVVEYGII